MIEHDLDKADGELRAMLADMVNVPVLAAIQQSNATLISLILESMEKESATTVSQIGNKLKAILDSIDDLDSRTSQAQIEAAAARHDTAKRCAAISAGIEGVGNATGLLPARVSEAVAGDFANTGRRLDEISESLIAANEVTKQASDVAFRNMQVRLEAIEAQRLSDREAEMRILRSLRKLVMFAGGVAVAGLLSTIAVLIHAYG